MIKLSLITQELLKIPSISEKYDKKYIDGLVKEQLAVREYKRIWGDGGNINEEADGVDDDTEDEIELDPNKITVPDDEPDDIVISDDELIPNDSEEVIDIDNEDDEVELNPNKITISEPEPPTPEQQEKQAEYITISKEQARELLSYKGKIFNAIFTKKDGKLRSMNGLTGVRKYTSGGELPYSPKEKGVIPVYDLKIGNGPAGYRMLNLDGLKTLNINGKKYKIDPFLKENMKKSELINIIKEVVRSTQPQRVTPERETITKPDVAPERKPKRRTLSPPKESPTTKPKAEGVIKENEQDIANKIASRFNKLSK